MLKQINTHHYHLTAIDFIRDEKSRWAIFWNEVVEKA